MKSAANVDLKISQPHVEDGKNTLKTQDSGINARVSSPELYEHESTRLDSEEISQQIDQPVTAPVKLTGVGIETVGDDGKQSIIDEALWDQSPASSEPGFALVASWRLGGITESTIQSRFLVSVVMKLLPRTDSMGVSKHHDSLFFERPFIPLFWFYDRILESAGRPDRLGKDDARDLRILRDWYEKSLLAEHVEIRNTLNSGYVTFDLLWAL